MKEDVITFGKRLSIFLKSQIPDALDASGGSELVCHCKYCLDNSPGHGHLYIKIPQTKDEAILFYCFKCHASGILTSKVLLDWGIYNAEIAATLDNLSKTHRSPYIGYNKQRFQFVNHVTDVNLANMKLKYINDRIGTNLTINECLRQKIIFNLKDALDYNEIDTYTRSLSIINQLNWSFLGFLSLDNNFVNLRRICDEGIVYETIDKRYITYNIHNSQNNNEKFYVLPTSIDLIKLRTLDIHIAEGPFDILSIKYNLRYNSPGIFAAVTGSNYKKLIWTLITVYKIVSFNLHIYPDNDRYGNDEVIDDLAQLFWPYLGEMVIHRNCYQNEKDFGVPLNRIDEKIYCIDLYK